MSLRNGLSDYAFSKLHDNNDETVAMIAYLNTPENNEAIGDAWEEILENKPNVDTGDVFSLVEELDFEVLIICTDWD